MGGHELLPALEGEEEFGDCAEGECARVEEAFCVDGLDYFALEAAEGDGGGEPGEGRVYAWVEDLCAVSGWGFG